MQQRSEFDCVIAALATAAHVHYETSSEVATVRGLDWSRRGISIADLRDIAGAFKLTTMPARRWVVDDRVKEAFLIVAWPWGGLHCVYVLNQWVYDPLEPREATLTEGLNYFEPVWIVEIKR